MQTALVSPKPLHTLFITSIVSSHMYLFIQDLFQVTFVNCKIQSNYVAVTCSDNTRPHLLDGL